MMTTILPATPVSTGSSHRGAPRSHGDAFAATLAEVSGLDRSGGATRVPGPRTSVPTSRSGAPDGRSDGDQAGRPDGGVADGGMLPAAAGAPFASSRTHAADAPADAPGTDRSGAVPGNAWTAGRGAIGAAGASATTGGDSTSADAGGAVRAAGAGSSPSTASLPVGHTGAGSTTPAVAVGAATGAGSTTPAVAVDAVTTATGAGSSAAATGSDGAPLGTDGAGAEVSSGAGPALAPTAGAGSTTQTASVPADAAGDARSSRLPANAAPNPAVPDGAVPTGSAPALPSAGGTDAVGGPQAQPDAAVDAPRLAEHTGTGADRPEGVVRGVEGSSTTARAETAPRAEAAASSPAPPQPALSSQLAASLARLRTAPDGQHVLNIHVTPDDLGPVRVTAHIGADGVRIELVGMTEGARDALRGALSELRRELAATGFAADLDLGAEHGPSHHRRPERSADPRAPEPATAATPPTSAHPAAPPGGHGLDLLA